MLETSPRYKLQAELDGGVCALGGGGCRHENHAVQLGPTTVGSLEAPTVATPHPLPLKLTFGARDQ